MYHFATPHAYVDATEIMGIFLFFYVFLRISGESQCIIQNIHVFGMFGILIAHITINGTTVFHK